MNNILNDLNVNIRTKQTLPTVILTENRFHHSAYTRAYVLRTLIKLSEVYTTHLLEHIIDYTYATFQTPEALRNLLLSRDARLRTDEREVVLDVLPVDMEPDVLTRDLVKSIYDRIANRIVYCEFKEQASRESEMERYVFDIVVSSTLVEMNKFKVIAKQDVFSHIKADLHHLFGAGDVSIAMPRVVKFTHLNDTVHSSTPCKVEVRTQTREIFQSPETIISEIVDQLYSIYVIAGLDVTLDELLNKFAVSMGIVALQENTNSLRLKQLMVKNTYMIFCKLNEQSSNYCQYDYINDNFTNPTSNISIKGLSKNQAITILQDLKSSGRVSTGFVR